MKFIVHWPSGPIVCCEIHAVQFKKIGEVLGTHVAIIPSDTDAECLNCKNEKAEKTSEK